MAATTPILPKPKINTMGPGVLGPDFSFAEQIPFPNQIGVNPGNTLDSVYGALGGVAYYSDVIGFGAPSSSYDQNLGLKPIGVQVWMKSGMKCSNGANMWTYLNGIPTGGSLGSGVQNALAGAGMPALKGLAPGMMEDIQSALDPTPIMQSVFGSGFPVCKMVERTVGDQNGNISKVDSKGNTIYYVENPETVVKRGGLSYQSRWTLDRFVTQEEWNAETKRFCSNGSVNNGSCVESFCGSTEEVSPKWKQLVLLGVAVGGLLLLIYGSKMRRR
jgi:hypothetical protein